MHVDEIKLATNFQRNHGFSLPLILRSNFGNFTVCSHVARTQLQLPRTHIYTRSDNVTGLTTFIIVRSDTVEPCLMLLTGLTTFTIVRSEMVEPGQFRYAVKELTVEGGRPATVWLNAVKGRTDPLLQIRNVQLVLRDGVIVAINLDGDCVVRRS